MRACGAGIHTRHACTDGAELGRQVAEYCLKALKLDLASHGHTLFDSARQGSALFDELGHPQAFSTFPPICRVELLNGGFRAAVASTRYRNYFWI